MVGRDSGAGTTPTAWCTGSALKLTDGMRGVADPPTKPRRLRPSAGNQPVAWYRGRLILTRHTGAVANRQLRGSATRGGAVRASAQSSTRRAVIRENAFAWEPTRRRRLRASASGRAPAASDRNRRPTATRPATVVRTIAPAPAPGSRRRRTTGLLRGDDTLTSDRTRKDRRCLRQLGTLRCGATADQRTTPEPARASVGGRDDDEFSVDCLSRPPTSQPAQRE